MRGIYKSGHKALKTLLIFGLFTGLISCGAKENTSAPPPPPTVTVSPPVLREVTQHAEFTGTTRASGFVEIRARVEGFLEKIHFNPSRKVEEGDLLFTIDQKPYIAELNQAKAEVAIREAELKQTEATLGRVQRAFKSKAVSEIEVIDAEAKAKKAEAALQAARATVEKADLRLSYTQIHAPISGQIGRSLEDAGNLVGTAGDNTLLTTIVNDQPIYAYFAVSETDLLQYQKRVRSRKAAGREEPIDEQNYPVFLGLPTEEGYPHQGRLDYIGNRVDETTGTIEVRGVFENEAGVLLPGLFARIRLPMGAPEEALLVPEGALGRDQAGRYLLTVNADGVVEKKTVTVGQKEGEMRVIDSGIDPDDRVVVTGILKARPGQPVTPVSAETVSQTPEGGAS